MHRIDCVRQTKKHVGIITRVCRFFHYHGQICNNFVVLQKSFQRECSYYQLTMQYPKHELCTINEQEYALEPPLMFHVAFHWWTHDYMIIMEDLTLREGYQMLSTEKGASKEVYDVMIRMRCVNN